MNRLIHSPMKFLPIACLILFAGASMTHKPEMHLGTAHTVDSLGACQGAAMIEGTLYLYGDREVGMMRAYQVRQDSLIYQNREWKMTVDGADLINHPTGIAWQPKMPVFIGNSIRLNKEGTMWKAVIYQIDWAGFQRTGTLDGNVLNTIEDDACIQGTRPEYVRHKNKWYVATADYGDKKNEVRLYDAQLLKKAKKTSQQGVLVARFDCGPWVQNLHWIEEKGILILVQNQIEGRKWRFTFLDLEKSLAEGKQHVIRTVDMDKTDELEGFTMLNSAGSGVAVTSSRKQNAHLVKIAW